MRNRLLIISFLLLFPLLNFGQINSTPKNLKTAIKLLSKDCPIDLKEKIKITSNDSLIYLISPWGGTYERISNWTSDSLPTPKLISYFKKREIEIPKLQETAILIAFKNYLLEGNYDEKKILAPIQLKEKKRKAEALIRYTTDTINGIYIPKDLDDSFVELEKIWKDSINIKLKKLEQEMHFGFGMWLRNNWELWGGSRLSKFFNELEIHHPDDMSGIILKSYKRFLSNEPILLDDQISFYKKYWKEMEEKDNSAKKAEFEKYKIGDTVLFNYDYGYVSIEQEKKRDDDLCIAKGKILEKDEKYYSIKIQLIDGCDKKGIISHDNINTLIFDTKTKKYEKPRKRIITHMKIGKMYWFHYSDWEVIE